MPKGIQLSEGHKMKLSVAHKGKRLGIPLSEETKQRIRVKAIERAHSKPTVLKNKRCLRCGEEFRWSCSYKQWAGRKYCSVQCANSYVRTEKHIEQCRKNAQARKGVPLSEEHKKKVVSALSGVWLGRKHTKESKEKMSLANRTFLFRNTSIEIKLQNFLKANNVPFQTNYPILGQPDIFIKPNICIFADGCYWHKCPQCGYDDQERIEKDRRVTETLTKRGYVVIRLWEHDINNGINDGLKKIIYV